jgi:hypothetical protein
LRSLELEGPDLRVVVFVDLDNLGSLFFTHLQLTQLRPTVRLMAFSNEHITSSRLFTLADLRVMQQLILEQRLEVILFFLEIREKEKK